MAIAEHGIHYVRGRLTICSGTTTLRRATFGALEVTWPARTEELRDKTSPGSSRWLRTRQPECGVPDDNWLRSFRLTATSWQGICPPHPE
jgi:hypothetical protein